jgi:hypothetical protein
LVSVGAGDLVDGAVSAQQTEFAADPGRAAAGLSRRGGWLSEVRVLEVAIAQASSLADGWCRSMKR